VPTVGEGARGTQPIEQRLRLVQPLGTDEPFDEVASGPAVGGHAARHRLLEQRDGGVELASLQVPGDHVRRLLRRDRHTEDQHPVDHAAGRGHTLGAEADVDQPLEVLARGDPTVLDEAHRRPPGAVGIAGSDPGLQHGVAVEARRLGATLPHRVERPFRSFGVPRLRVRDEELGVHVTGELHARLAQPLEQADGPVGVAGASDHRDELGRQPRRRTTTDLQHQVDDGPGVLDGAPVDAVAQERLVLGIRGRLAPVCHLTDDGPCGREPLRGEVDAQDLRRVLGVGVDPLVVELVEHREGFVGTTRAAGRDGEVPAGRRVDLDARRAHRVEHPPCPGEVASVEVCLEQQAVVGLAGGDVPLLHRVEDLLHHAQIAGEATHGVEVLVVGFRHGTTSSRPAGDAGSNVSESSR
jgi:hypothetical protein